MKLDPEQVDQLAQIIRQLELKHQAIFAAWQIAFARLVSHLGRNGHLDIEAFKTAVQMDHPYIPPELRPQILETLSNLADAIGNCAASVRIDLQ